MTVNELIAHFQMKRQHALLFYQDLHSLNMQEYYKKYKKDQIQIITRFDKFYPILLKQIYDPPWVLYYKGDITLASPKKMLAVVDTRKPSQQAGYKLNVIVRPLIWNGWCIVSGLAYGIDGMSHRLTLEEQGKTIAVLGSGFYSIYPTIHTELAHHIAEKGLLLSEFRPNQRPEKWQFPLRNRIISGLSNGTLVVEAQERSGSLITADLALEYGREVFAVPGAIFQKESKGTNLLIQQGAKLVLNEKDIIEELQFG
ncbi:DNA-processing protein DprA [Bacillus taeanensis]|uniref:DNA-protecting protein DprA n=1 Tax=Bacillus taeanensis TaxID=273032 RepID=A0A366XXI9_9BACI|nr:DNA-processing protein DprA [Bacillus taeanensis]RBW69865.1 DNA-protecting protein DprA [Bacillus taeanensis]